MELIAEDESIAGLYRIRGIVSYIHTYIHTSKFSGRRGQSWHDHINSMGMRESDSSTTYVACASLLLGLLVYIVGI